MVMYIFNEETISLVLIKLHAHPQIIPKATEIFQKI